MPGALLAPGEGRAVMTMTVKTACAGCCCVISVSPHTIEEKDEAVFWPLRQGAACRLWRHQRDSVLLVSPSDALWLMPELP